MNAYIERFFRSAREECLDHIIFFSPEHLEQVLREYIDHYNSERPHQGLGNRTIGPWQVGQGEILCDERLGGLLKSFRRAA
jgi:putative transposase